MSYILQKLQSGAKFISEKRFDDARDIYDELLHVIPSFPDAYYGLYKVELLSQNSKKALEYFKKALFSLSLTAPYKEQDGELFDKWISEYNSLTKEELFLEPKEYPFSKKLEIELKKLLNKKKYKQLFDRLKLYKTKYGLSKEMIYTFMLSLDKLGFLEDACVAGYSVCKIFPDDYEKLKTTAGVFVKASLYYPAIKIYLRANTLKPDEHTPLHNLGAIALEMEQNIAAKTFFYKALKSKPESIPTRTQLVDCLVEEGKFDVSKKIITAGQKYVDNIDLEFFSFYYKAFFDDTLKELFSNYKYDKKYLSIYFNLGVLFGDKDMVSENLNQIMKNFKDSKTNVTQKSSIGKKLAKLDKIVTLMPVGRSGSLFFHSLFDGSCDVSTIPGVYLKGFFGNGVWNKLYSSSKNKKWREDLTQRFLRIYDAIFDGKSTAPVPGDPMSGKTGIGESCGLTRLGAEQNIVLRVDKDKFETLLLTYLKDFNDISQRDFFKLIHIVWDETIGDTREKKLIFYHIHNPSIIEYAKCVKLFPENRNIYIVRDVIKAAESWMYTQMPHDDKLKKLAKLNYTQKINGLSMLFSKIYGRVFVMLVYLRGHMVISKDASYAVRLEDIKTNPKTMMKNIAEFLGIEYDDNLLKSEFLGLKYFGPKSKLHKNIQGFDNANIKRGYVLFSDKDLETLQSVFYPWQKVFGYTDKPKPTQDEIKTAIEANENLFDFEKRFATVIGVKFEDINFDIVGKRKRIFKYILNNLEIIESDLKNIKIVE